MDNKDFKVINITDTLLHLTSASAEKEIINKDYSPFLKILCLSIYTSFNHYTIIEGVMMKKIEEFILIQKYSYLYKYKILKTLNVKINKDRICLIFIINNDYNIYNIKDYTSDKILSIFFLLNYLKNKKIKLNNYIITNSFSLEVNYLNKDFQNIIESEEFINNINYILNIIEKNISFLLVLSYSKIFLLDICNLFIEYFKIKNISSKKLDEILMILNLHDNNKEAIQEFLSSKTNLVMIQIQYCNFLLNLDYYIRRENE